MVKTYSDLCRETRNRLEPGDGPDAIFRARELVAFASGRTVPELLRDIGVFAPDTVLEKLEELVTVYLAGKPLPYILGEWSFCGLTLRVTPDVLIPRDDTMAVTELAAEKARLTAMPRILDLCTGSGCIGLALASQIGKARVTLADLSEEALRIAKDNIGLTGFKSRVAAVRADALGTPPAFLREYDVLVSNPPYVTEAEMQTLPVSVRDYEPRMALDGGADGLDFYRAVCRNYAPVLRDGGWLCFEFGMGQQDAVAEILTENRFGELEFRRDSSDIIRAVAARKYGKEESYGEDC